jgi:hypothetical protein
LFVAVQYAHGNLYHMNRQTITKSMIVASVRCPTRLQRIASRSTQAATTSVAAYHGLIVQNRARELVSGGVLVGRNPDDTCPLTYTKALMDDATVPAIFEAGFFHNGVEVFADILKRLGSSWELTEVKSATNTTDEHIFDAAIQAYIIEGSGITLERITLQSINSEATSPDAGRAAFAYENITDECRDMYPAVEDAIMQCRSILSGEPIQCELTSRCNNPSSCEFKTDCQKEWTEYPVSCLPHGHVVAAKLRERGIYDIRDIPDGILKSSNHIRVRNVTRDGKPLIGKREADVLKTLPYPHNFIDFETAQSPFSMFEGVAPYEQVPFQWSCHTQQECGQLEHREFLDITGNDPRRGFATSLIGACGNVGTVIVYNATFERRVLTYLAALFPDLAHALESITTRLFDLLDVTRDAYYHPAMKGSWSLKAILPCLVPELSYDNLEGVKNGEMAQLAYLRAIEKGLPLNVLESIRKSLLKYCDLDTYSMVRVVETLKTMAA